MSNLDRFPRFVIVVLTLGLVVGTLAVSAANRQTDTSPTGPISTRSEIQDAADEVPLRLPSSFKVNVFADNLDNPRVINWDPMGRLLVSIPSRGQVVALIDENHDGVADSRVVVADGLNRPHGITFSYDEVNQCKLIVAETDQLVSFDYDDATATVSNKTILTQLPSGTGHFTRTVEIGPDERLYVSIGSSCNVCEEQDQRRAAILSMNLDGSDIRRHAAGLRNSVFFTWDSRDNQMWATDMGRDWLGDDTPPDEINIIQEGKHYGWPYCYGQQIHDRNYDSSVIRAQFCQQESVASHVDIPAHSAPLGLAFVPGNSSWPEDYRNDLIVAYHGSWNRSKPTGYKIVRIKLDENNRPQEIDDFISGWTINGQDEPWGRPVDVKFSADHNLYISDDQAGAIYRVSLVSPGDGV